MKTTNTYKMNAQMNAQMLKATGMNISYIS